MTETLYACAVAAAAMGGPTPSGAYFVDRLMANVCKHNVTKLIYDIDRLAQDISGGIIATMPSESDLRNPEIGKWVEKYLRGVDGVPTEDRMRVGRLLENMTGGTALVESMHGASSPAWRRRRSSPLTLPAWVTPASKRSRLISGRPRRFFVEKPGPRCKKYMEKE